MNFALQLAQNWYVQTCCRVGCGCSWAMPNELDNRLRESHEAFYCPMGHSQHYTEKSDKEKLQEQLATNQRWLENANKRTDEQRLRAESAEHRERAQKGAKTRIKNRIAKGVCPCCNRSFENLRQHMDSKHPQFASAD